MDTLAPLARRRGAVVRVLAFALSALLALPSCDGHPGQPLALVAVMAMWGAFLLLFDRRYL